jgi:hypothetical protein
VENKDYLMRQLETFGEALRKLLSKAPLLKESDVTDLQVAEFSELMKASIGLKLDDAVNSTNEAFLTSLLDKKMTVTDLSNIINLLVELSAVENVLLPANHSHQLLSKALFLGDYLTTNQKMAYFGNVTALNEAKRILK